MNDKTTVNTQDESALVTMCLTGYINTIKKLTNALIAVTICWLLTVGGFLIYLSQYEMQVTTYGNFEQSKINTSTGTIQNQADTINVTNGVADNENNK